jgi:hypothetical protein
VSRIKEYYHEEICEGLKECNDRELYALRRETSTHLSLRKEIITVIVRTSEDETQTDLGGELPNDGRVRGQ